jgi:DNA-binding LytR/AlgR family response regulator
MKIIIIEDELKAAKSLAGTISKIRPDAEVIAHLQSVESAVEYFTTHEQPDLVFMDVQLSDGLCFNVLLYFVQPLESTRWMLSKRMVSITF